MTEVPTPGSPGTGPPGAGPPGAGPPASQPSGSPPPEPQPPAPGSHEFALRASEDIYVGQIVGLRRDEVAMPGGVTARREVVEHLGAVAIAAVDEDERITLIHQYRHPIGRRMWELPAGLLDVAGENPVDTARRELAEEVGLAARRWDTLVDVAASTGFTDEVVRVFLARELHQVSRTIAGGEEADLTMTSVSLSEAVRMTLAGELINSATVGGVLAAHAVLTGAERPREPDAPWRDRPVRFARRTQGA